MATCCNMAAEAQKLPVRGNFDTSLYTTTHAFRSLWRAASSAGRDAHTFSETSPYYISNSYCYTSPTLDRGTCANSHSSPNANRDTCARAWTL